MKAGSQRIAADLSEFGFVESSPLQDGRNMVMVIGPTKKKADAKAEAKAKGTTPRVRRDRSGGEEAHATDTVEEGGPLPPPLLFRHTVWCVF